MQDQCLDALDAREREAGDRAAVGPDHARPVQVADVDLPIDREREVVGYELDLEQRVDVVGVPVRERALEGPAEAVVREYEAAAKDIETLGEELTERAKQCEAMMRDALLVTDELKETAARYRAEAKRVFDQIESCSLLTAEVRKICEDMKDRLAKPAVAETKAQV